MTPVSLERFKLETSNLVRRWKIPSHDNKWIKIETKGLIVIWQFFSHIANRPSNNSAKDCAILSKFGVQTDLDIANAKRVPSLKPKPEVDFRLYGPHLEKSI